MPQVLLGLGGNLGDVRATMDKALARLGADGALCAKRVSSDYRTPPWGIADQPPFINRCALVDTALTPRALLTRVLDVERALGRDRTAATRWGPRRIDIDILDYEGVTLDEPGLVLPHPHLFERAFVLVPLAEIVPEQRIAGRRVADACAALDAAGIERLQTLAPPA